MPEGFPSGIPGIEEEIETAMQQAPQLILQSINHNPQFVDFF